MRGRKPYPNSGDLYGGPLYPGNGYPARPGENRPGLSAFGRLAMGQTLGKPSILLYDSTNPRVQNAGVDMFTLEGDDLDAQQLTITLHPPRVVPLSFTEASARLDQQNLTGEQTNAEVTVGVFPGTNRPVLWPPLEALIEFGVGGVSTQVVVDFVNGITLTVEASYLRAHAQISQSRESGDIFGTSAAYYLAAHVGPGFAESHAQRTVFAGAVADRNESDVFDVPRFAKVATLIGCRDPKHATPALSVGWIRFWQSPQGEHGVSDSFVSGPDVRVEVPNAAQYFTVINQSGHRMKMSVIFELAL